VKGLHKKKEGVAGCESIMGRGERGRHQSVAVVSIVSAPGGGSAL
jgi:hypothetical protein